MMLNFFLPTGRNPGRLFPRKRSRLRAGSGGGPHQGKTHRVHGRLQRGRARKRERRNQVQHGRPRDGRKVPDKQERRQGHLHRRLHPRNCW